MIVESSLIYKFIYSIKIFVSALFQARGFLKFKRLLDRFFECYQEEWLKNMEVIKVN